MEVIMTKRKYIAPETDYVTVELEQGFMKGSVVPKDEQDEPTISINNQEVGAESNYFDNPNEGWDF